MNEVSKNILVRAVSGPALINIDFAQTSPQAAESSRKSISKQASLSPVIRRSERAKNIIHSVESTPKKPQTRATTSKAVLPSTIFVDSDAKLSLENQKSKLHGHSKPEPKQKKLQSPPPSPSPAPKKPAGATPLDKKPEPKLHYLNQKEREKRTTTVKPKPVVVDSDSSKEEDTFVGDSPMAISPVAPQKHYPTRAGRAGAPVKEMDNENDDTKNAQEKASTNETAQAPKKRNRRVVMSEDESEIEDDVMEVDEPPKKKARHENVFPPSIRTYKMAKYGRKGRTSSPMPVPVESRPVDVDFDEVPTSEKGSNLASKKTEKKHVLGNKRGKENVPLKDRAQMVKEATKADQEKEKRVLRTKPRQKDEPLKDVKPKPKIISRALPVGLLFSRRRCEQLTFIHYRRMPPVLQSSLKMHEKESPAGPRGRRRRSTNQTLS